MYVYTYINTTPNRDLHALYPFVQPCIFGLGTEFTFSNLRIDDNETNEKNTPQIYFTWLVIPSALQVKATFVY